MKTVLIEKTTIGSSESEVIMLHDLMNNTSKYIYTFESNYKKWVHDEVSAYRSNGYRIWNETDIKL